MKNEDLKQIIFFNELKKEPLENVIDYWATMNLNNLDNYLSPSEHPEIKKRIKEILIILENKEVKNRSVREILHSEGTVSIKDLLKNK